MNDSHWLAELHRFGLIRASFIPEDIFQRMRLLSRHRTNLTSKAFARVAGGGDWEAAGWRRIDSPIDGLPAFTEGGEFN